MVRLMPGSYGIVRHPGDSNTCVTTPLGVAEKFKPYEGAEVGLTSVRDTWNRALKWANGIQRCTLENSFEKKLDHCCLPQSSEFNDMIWNIL